MKIRRHQTCFLVKYFEISQTPTRVFGCVKSESYKIIVTHALCCLPLTVTCTLAGIHQVCLQSLQRRKNYTRPGIAFRFSCSVQRLVT